LKGKEMKTYDWQENANIKRKERELRIKDLKDKTLV